MSVMQNLRINANNIMMEAQNIQSVLTCCPTAKNLKEASDCLNNSKEMQYLISTMNLPLFGSDNQFTLGIYIDDLLQKDLEKGLDYFATLMQLFAVDPAYSKYKDNLSDIANAATELNKTQIFREYVKAYQLFEEDTSQEAESTRKAMDIMCIRITNLITEDPKPTYRN